MDQLPFSGIGIVALIALALLIFGLLKKILWLVVAVLVVAAAVGALWVAAGNSVDVG